MKQSTWYQVEGSGPLFLTRPVRPNLPPKSLCKYWPPEDWKEKRAVLRFQHVDEMPDQHFLLVEDLGHYLLETILNPCVALCPICARPVSGFKRRRDEFFLTKQLWPANLKLDYIPPERSSDGSGD